jgi:hypothetical protein
VIEIVLGHCKAALFTKSLRKAVVLTAITPSARDNELVRTDASDRYLKRIAVLDIQPIFILSRSVATRADF